MSAKQSPEARMVRIKIEEGNTGLFYASSPDLKGLLVAEPTIPELEKQIPEAIANLYKACGEAVFVTKLRDGSEAEFRPWVTLPIEMLKRATAH